MTAKIINLRRARKAKARAEGDKRAEANRLKFGRTKAERDTAKAQDTLAARRLAAHRRDPDDEEP
jgi:hypothetical protein